MIKWIYLAFIMLFKIIILPSEEGKIYRFMILMNNPH